MHFVQGLYCGLFIQCGRIARHSQCIEPSNYMPQCRQPFKQKIASFQFLCSIFANINGTVNVLEDSLCDWTQFPFEKYEGNIELLGGEEWRKGQAIELYISKANFMRHEIQGGRKYYKKFKEESLKALTFHPQYQRYAEINLQNIAKKVLLS